MVMNKQGILFMCMRSSSFPLLNIGHVYPLFWPLRNTRQLYSEYFAPKLVDISAYCKGRKVILVGLPGAFTPTWSIDKVPGYLKAQDALKSDGVGEVVVCYITNCAVMKAWGMDQSIEGSMITFMGNPATEFTSDLDMKMTHPGTISVGIIGRCKRCAIYVEDSVVNNFAISESDDDPAGNEDP